MWHEHTLGVARGARGVTYPRGILSTGFDILIVGGLRRQRRPKRQHTVNVRLELVFGNNQNMLESRALISDFQHLREVVGVSNANPGSAALQSMPDAIWTEEHRCQAGHNPCFEAAYV